MGESAKRQGRTDGIRQITTVGILGVTHDQEMRMKYHLTLDVIQELILEFEPDVICGEVLPSSWERYRTDPADRGYWGEPNSEYWDLIFPLCDTENYIFIPIDWGELDVWADFDPFNGYGEERRKELQEQLEHWFQKQLSTWNEGRIPLNSREYDAVTKRMYEWLEQLNPQAHLLRWTCRHLIMVQRLKNAIKLHAGKRLLCIVGADHNYMLQEGLIAEPAVNLIYPLRK